MLKSTEGGALRIYKLIMDSSIFGFDIELFRFTTLSSQTAWRQIFTPDSLLAPNFYARQPGANLSSVVKKKKRAKIQTEL